MRAPPPAGSSAGWARWRAEGCGGRAREAAMLSFPAGGGQLRVAPPGAPRPTTASAPRARPRRLLLRLPRGSVRAGAARPAAPSRRLLLPSAPLPARRAPASLPPPPGFPPTARARSAFRLPPLFLALLLSLGRLRLAPHYPDPAEPLPCQTGLGGTRPPDHVPGLYLLAPGQRAFPSCAWSSPNLRAIRPAQGPHLSTRRPSWSLTLFNTLSGQQEGQVPPE